MGLLDGMLGNVLGGMLGGGQQQGGGALGSILGQLGGGSSNQSTGMQGVGAAAFMALALQLIQQNGGIGGLVDKFRAAGLGQHADSWVGTGANLPVDADQLRGALGSGGLSQLAHKFGMSSDEASGGLAQLLPELVNQMTPQGEIPAHDHQAISDALAALAPKANT